MSVKQKLSEMLSFVAKNIFAILPILGFTVAISYFVGWSYKSLRFAATYEATQAKVDTCFYEVVHGDQNSSSYFRFELDVAGLDYNIVKNTSYKLRLKFWDPKPNKDWCAFKGEVINVYYSDQVKVATTFWDQTKKPNFINLTLAVESAGIIIGLIFFFILVLGVVSSGIFFLVNAVKSMLKNITKPTKEQGQGVYIIAYFNQIFMPGVAILLSALLIVFLGLSIVKGILFIEGYHYIITGFVFIVGITLACFGPGAIVNGVYYLKSTKSEVIVFLRNILVVGALGKLATNIRLFFTGDFDLLSNDSLKKYLLDILKGMF